MITGSVSNYLEPFVNVTLTCVDRSEIGLAAIIDSGFNGGLTLPQALVDRLGWPFMSSEEVVLANGNVYSMKTYRGLVKWKGEDRITTVFISESKASLGTALLDGSELWIQFRRGGDVVISEIMLDRQLTPKSLTKPLLGLVGGIGSGKSVVASALAERGGFLITADSFGHEALEQPDILARIAERWQDRVLDDQGKVDRKKMAAIVFASSVERTNLEALVFPFIEERIRAELAKAQADPQIPFIVLDAAIMLEAGWNNVCSRIVYVHAPRAIRLERLMTNRGWNAQDIANREAAQLPLSVKAARADAAIDNSGTVENTRRQVDALLRSWHIL